MTFELPFLELLGGAVGVLLTLLVFSYLLGDHFLVRLIFYGYVGLMAGYAVLLSFNSVIYPLLFQPLLRDPVGGAIQIAVPLVLSGLLLFKVSTRFSILGNLSLAFLVGVGLAALIGGAIQGTLVPQISAVISPFDLAQASLAAQDRISVIVQGFLILFGTVVTLSYFHYGARPRASGPPRRLEWIETLGWMGQFFIAIALGLIFAGLLKAGFVALVERARTLLDFVNLIQQGF
ncbi:MAG: hypothetical protein N3D16_07500 [Anaerolineales bacterium]|nr:hypothetical protein [Anaerolineales bacterium]